MKQYEIDMLVKKIIHEMNPHKNPKGEFYSKSAKETTSEVKFSGVSATVARQSAVPFSPSRDDALGDYS